MFNHSMEEIEFSIRLEFDVIKEFIPSIVKVHNENIKDLKNKDFSWSSDPDFCSKYCEFLSDSMKNLSFQLAIISLNKHIEVNLKKIFKVHTPSEKLNSNNFYIGKQKEFFNSEILIKIKENSEVKRNKIDDFEKIPYYSSYNEIRIINNAIKHGSYISKELSEISNFWKKNEGIDFNKINVIEEVYEKLLVNSDFFLREVVKYTKLSIDKRHLKSKA